MSRRASVPQTVIDGLQLAALIGVGGVALALILSPKARSTASDIMTPGWWKTYHNWAMNNRRLTREWWEEFKRNIGVFDIELNAAGRAFVEWWQWDAPTVSGDNWEPGHMIQGPASGQDFFTPGQFPGDKVGL